MKTLKVNIAGTITQVTRPELNAYLYANPDYLESYFIIEEKD